MMRTVRVIDPISLGAFAAGFNLPWLTLLYGEPPSDGTCCELITLRGAPLGVATYRNGVLETS